jgi:hypothetical protein
MGNMLAATIFDVVVGKLKAGEQKFLRRQVPFMQYGSTFSHSYERATNNRIHKRKAERS